MFAQYSRNLHVLSSVLQSLTIAETETSPGMTGVGHPKTNFKTEFDVPGNNTNDIPDVSRYA